MLTFPTGQRSLGSRLRLLLLTTGVLFAGSDLIGQPSAGYRIEDLGELGGGFARARAINGWGQIVGESLLPAPGSIEHGFVWQSGAVTDLGTLGGARSRALAVNAQGTIGGWAQNATGQTKPALWVSGAIHELSTLGGPHGTVWGLNNSGAAVGNAYVTASVYHAARWQVGSVVDLGTLGGAYSVAYGINEAGLVVGGADDLSGVQQACLWALYGPMSLGSLSGGSWSTARAINDQGEIILWGRPAGASDNHAAFWNGELASPVLDLGTFGGSESWAYGLNNLGDVVGWAEFELGNYHAFVWEGGAITDLGTLGGMFSSAYDINDDGVIVGFAHDALNRTHAVRWVPVPEPSAFSSVMAALAAWAAFVAVRRRSLAWRGSASDHLRFQI